MIELTGSVPAGCPSWDFLKPEFDKLSNVIWTGRAFYMLRSRGADLVLTVPSHGVTYQVAVQVRTGDNPIDLVRLLACRLMRRVLL